MRLRSLAVGIAAAQLVLLLAAGSAAGLSLEQIGTFAKPVYVTSAPDDADQLFVVERQGTIKGVEGETAGTYLDLTSLVSSASGERAMASIAFDPEFATSGKFYVAYTAKDDAEQDEGDIVVEELVEPENPEDPFARRRVLTIPHNEYDIHNGGQLQFGPDGYLYLSTGDGGLLDPYHAAQDLRAHSARSSASTPIQTRRSAIRRLPTTRSRVDLGRPRSSGRSACATRSASPSIASLAIWRSATSARASARRSTGSRARRRAPLAGKAATSAGAAAREG